MNAAANPVAGLSRLATIKRRISPLAYIYALQMPLILALLDSMMNNVDGMPPKSWTQALQSIAVGFFENAAFFVLPLSPLMSAACAWGPRAGHARNVFLGSAAIFGAGFAAQLVEFHFTGQLFSWDDWRDQVMNYTDVLVPTVLLTVAYEFHRRGLQTAAEFQRDSVARAQLDTERDRARLQTLRAQIEPHFLFNTLANMRRLYQLDHAAGASMLDNLLRYFQSALPRMRDDQCSLADEAELMESYLNIQRIRMGRRLAFEIDIPDMLCAERVPTMMLLTLIENAIKHGLDPLPEGGFLQVTVRRVDAGLELRVADTGRGIVRDNDSGTGTGLANLRARLDALHGAAARLALTPAQPRGVIARITLPRTP